jgi:hypothetical protein
MGCAKRELLLATCPRTPERPLAFREMRVGAASDLCIFAEVRTRNCDERIGQTPVRSLPRTNSSAVQAILKASLPQATDWTAPIRFHTNAVKMHATPNMTFRLPFPRIAAIEQITIAISFTRTIPIRPLL